MNKRLVIKPLAVEQLSESAEWYENQQAGLGVRFIESFENTVKHIAGYPQHYQKRYKNFKLALITGFPYLIAFEESERELVLYTITHAHKLPAKRYKKK